LSSQQPWQFSGLQFAHCAFRQLSPNEEQTAQVLPPKPHALVALPSWQTPLSSQQPGQFSTPQAEEQTWFWHDPPSSPQASQRVPPSPQEMSLVPGSHTPLPSQQPKEQLSAPQVGCGTHCPPLHVWPSWAQSVQGSPSKPHAIGSVPETHWVPAQHPLQVEPEHPGATLEQACCVVSHPVKSRAGQLAHCSPPVPHWVVAVPAWQVPVPSQQPEGQLMALHGVTSGTDVSRPSGSPPSPTSR